ncbi:PIN domain-containing protein [Modestobacter sp. I12A-02628]|uniref:Ribonuclease VapC n=1 Tax=Goekera deserti TaxID=2497753 RepID=A0A7K3WCT6_9ACTN|nr:type II toxin-antitoxin system VapC family toxin [Goekera deserti]MPQ98608.1 PIN domain-containing protein [Goekera deserti]NDI49022.1 PIN domain-containing protein [Goekera deserti]NEL54187.1 type II toxin-antitoxin system VapC family toxin [Goekera deserti]
MNVYIDTSALLKLVKREADTPALLAWLAAARRRLFGSALLHTEMYRAGLAYGLPRSAIDAVLGPVHVITVTPELLRRAGRVPAAPGRLLGTLDAVHLVSAESAAVDTLLTYDSQLSDAAAFHGLAVVAPG